MAATTFIYGLIHPETGLIFYVGKSDDPKKRLRLHINEARSRRYPRHRFIDDLAQRGLRPSVMVLESVPVGEWQDHEKRHIAILKSAGVVLVNSTEGGGTYPDWSGKRHSEETKRKMSAASRGKPKGPMSAEARANLSARRKGQPSHRRGMPALNRRAVYQYNLQGQYLRSFPSGRLAGAETGIDASEITRCCNGRVSRAGNFLFRWEHSACGVAPWINPHFKPVHTVDEAGKVIDTFPSIKAASASIGIDTAGISACLKGTGKQKTAGGYRWRYVEKEPL